MNRINKGMMATTDNESARRVKASIRAEDYVVFGLMKGVGIKDISAQHVHDGTYDEAAQTPNHPIDRTQAEFLFNLQREDSAHTDDKVKQLLAVSSSLATITLVFAHDVNPRWLVVVIIALLIACVYLCITVLGVRSYQMPVLEDSTLPENNLTWARDLLSSYFANRSRHWSRVDRYRAASRYFRMALILTPIAAILTREKPNEIPAVQASLTQIAGSLERLSLQATELVRQDSISVASHLSSHDSVLRDASLAKNSKHHSIPRKAHSRAMPSP